MSIRRRVVALLIGTGVLAGANLATGAAAHGYGVTTRVPVIAVSASTVSPGGSLTVQGAYFTPNGTASLSLHSDPVQLGTAPVDADGSFAVVITVPADEPTGRHRVDALDVPTGDVASVTLTVSAPVSGPGTGGSGGLAGTGVPARGLLALALAILAAGVLAESIGRRRSANKSRAQL